jgi:virginiamycin B lyase
MEKTQFLGITILGPTDSIYDDNAAFINRDRIELDRAAQIGIKTHRHTGLPGLTNPVAAPSAEVVASGGAIASDLILNVGYTLQDNQQGETELSEVATVSTPSPLSIPQVAPSAVIDYSAGNLLTNSYYYAVTYTDGDGGETPLGPTVIAEREPGFPNGRVIVSNLTAGMGLVGAAGWRLYRSIGGGLFGLLATGGAEDDEFIDDGSQSPDCSAHPPGDTVNTTNQVSTLYVTLPEVDGDASFINLYASISGGFTGASLLGQYPLASAGETIEFTQLDFLDSSPPDVNRSYGGAPKIDPDTELLDWHWKRPVKTVGELPSEGNEEGDVRAILEAEEPTVYMFLNDEWKLLELGGGGSGSLQVALAGDPEEFLYWANENGTIGRVRSDGSDFDPEFITGLGSEWGIWDVTVDDTYIYWSDWNLDSIGRAKLDGSEVETEWIKSGSAPRGLAVNDTHIYWTVTGEKLGRANLDGSEPDLEFIVLVGSNVDGVDVDENWLYWADKGKNNIGRAKLDGSEVNTSFITAPNDCADLRVNSTHIYWVNDSGNTIGRANLDGSEPNNSLISGSSTGTGLALGPEHVYWIERGFKSVGRAELDGANPEPEFITGLNSPLGMEASSTPNISVLTERLEFAGSGVTVVVTDEGDGKAKVTITTPPGEGGGGTDGVVVTDDEDTVDPATTLRFQGSGVAIVGVEETNPSEATILIDVPEQAGGGSIVVRDDETAVDPAVDLEFAGSGVATVDVTDEGEDKARILITVPPIAEGPPGADGEDGVDGRTVLSGNGAPSSELGEDGDFYIDTEAWDIYGPKSGVWGEPTPLIGADGDDGAPGENGAPGVDGRTILSGSGPPASELGEDGDFYIDTEVWNVYGPKSGAWGEPTSLIGPVGEEGPHGSAVSVTASGVTVDPCFDIEFIGASGIDVSAEENDPNEIDITIAGPAALLASEAMGVIVHGSAAGTARPNNFKQYTWIGSVEPENMAEFDIWIET